MQETISKSTQRQQCMGGLWGLASHQVKLDMMFVKILIRDYSRKLIDAHMSSPFFGCE